MTVKFTNNASTTVATGINTTATSLVVASAAGFPALSGSGDYCYLTIQQAAGTNVEVVKATALSSNTFTIVRAQDGTSAGSWSVSDVVELRVTAALLTDIVDAATHDSSVLSVDSTNNRVGVNDTTPSVTLDISGTDAIALPVGTTAQRPAAGAGRFRYNSSLSQFEGYTDAWGAIGGGGTNTFTTDTFTANGSLVAFNLSQTVSSENNLLVFIDGVFQTQDAYAIATASGTTTLTFSAAPANGRKIVVYSVAAGISGANLNIDSMTGDGSDVTLTLTINTIKENTQVFIDGVYQAKANYSISGTTLTFSTAPPAGSAVECVTMTQTEINVPVDNTITSAKLSGALTTPSDLTVTGTFTSRGIDDNADATAITIDSSENVGIGMTPSAWHANWTALQLGATGFVGQYQAGATDITALGSNVFSDGTYKYIETDEAVIYKQQNGEHIFDVAASGSANAAISWTTALKINNSGSVGIGTISPVVKLAVKSSQEQLTLSEGDARGATFDYRSSTGNLNIATNGVNARTNPQFTLDLNGNVGIGSGASISPDADADNLVIQENGAAGITIGSSASSVGSIRFADSGSPRAGMIYYNHVGNEMRFYTNANERARIDSSGNVGIGATTYEGSVTSNASSVWISSFGYLSANINNDWGLGVNRTGTDGTLINLRKNGADVGFLGTLNSSIYIASPYGNDSGLRFSDRIIHPCTTAGSPRDDAIDLGYSAGRFDTIFAKTGSINTSDRNEKQNIEALSDAEQRVAVAAKGLLRKYRWKSAVAEKGDDARIHFGIIAQDLQAAFEAEGLDAARYGMWCSDTWTDEDTGEERTRLGVRYSELLAFIISAI